MDLLSYQPTLTEVASLFGKSSRWISDLRAKGEMPADGATLKQFIEAWAKLSRGKAEDQHKVRLAAAKADQAEMKTAQLRGDYLSRVEVSRAMQGAFARVRSRLLSIGSKIAPRVFGMTSVVEIQETITELVHEALAELASTEVRFQEAGGTAGAGAAHGDVAGDGGDGGNVVADIPAAAAADGEPVGRRGRNPSRPDAKPGGKRRAG